MPPHEAAEVAVGLWACAVVVALALLSGASRGRRAVDAAAAREGRETAVCDRSQAPGRADCPALSELEVERVRRFWPNAPESDTTG